MLDEPNIYKMENSYLNQSDLMQSLCDHCQNDTSDEGIVNYDQYNFLEADYGFCNFTFNETDCRDVNPWIRPWWVQTIWSILFGGMVVVATGGNLIVIWIVLTEKRMRTVTNIFLVNLSIADTMVSTLNVVFNFIYMLNSHWPFGNIYCKISQFVSLLSISSSVFTLMAISFDR